MISRRLNSVLKLLVCAAPLLLAACGPLLVPNQPPPSRPTPSTDRVVFKSLIDTVPREMRCAIEGPRRQPKIITTPRLVGLSDFGPPVRVRCYGEGYWEASVILYAGTNKPLLHRVLGGDRINIAKGTVRGGDTASGSEYPNQVIQTMRRNSFDSEDARDLYYARLIRDAKHDWGLLIDLGKLECARGVVSRKGASAVSQPTACRDELAGLNQFMRQDLQSLELERRRSSTP